MPDVIGPLDLHSLAVTSVLLSVLLLFLLFFFTIFICTFNIILFSVVVVLSLVYQPIFNTKTIKTYYLSLKTLRISRVKYTTHDNAQIYYIIVLDVVHIIQVYPLHLDWSTNLPRPPLYSLL